MAGNAELANQHDVQGSIQGSRNFIADRDAAAGKRQHQQIGPAGVRREDGGQPAPGVIAISETCCHHSLSVMAPQLRPASKLRMHIGMI